MLIPSHHTPFRELRGTASGTGGLSLFEKIATTVMVLLCVLFFSLRDRVCSAGINLVEQGQVKAVYLYNFLHVVTWPSVPKRAESSPVTSIGVLGASSLNAALDDLAESVRKRSGDPIRIVHLGSYREGMDLSEFRILFVGDSEREHFKEIISGLKHASVLTVADSEDFLQAGGMIALVEQQNRVRYRINRSATFEAGLRLSSQLLQSAISVIGE